MRAAMIFGAFLALMLFSAAAFAAGPFEITTKADKDFATPGEALKVTVTTKNPFGSGEFVDVFFTGENLQWLTAPTQALILRAGTTTSFDFWVTPSFGAQPKTYNYNISVVSRDKPAERFGDATFLYFVMEREAIQVVEFKADRESYKPGETVVINIKLKNAGTKEARNWTATLTFEGYPQAARTFNLPPIDVNQQVELRQQTDFPRATAKGQVTGMLTITDDKQRFVSTERIAFTIEETAVFATDRREAVFILFNTVTHSAKNNGNKRDVVRLTESVAAPLAWAYTFGQPPAEIAAGGRYVWTCDLAPGESCAVELRVNYWMTILVVVGVLIGVGIFYKQISKPTIRKRVTRKEKGIWKVHIEINNRGRDPIEDVEIVDPVPGIAKLGSEFSIEPHATKQTKSGLAVVWKLGKIMGKEERVITYEVRPALAVIGGFDLPAAKMSAKSAQGVPFTVYSEKVHIG